MQNNAYSEAVANVYELWYPNRDPAEIKFYQRFIGDQHTQALELACGSGQIMIPLIQQGFLVHGVDASRAMLDKAYMHLKNIGMQTALFEQSMHDFTLPDRYHLIYAPFGALHHLKDGNDVLCCLKRCRDHLHDDGILLMHFLQPPSQSLNTSWCKTSSAFRVSDAVTVDTYGQSTYDIQTMRMISQYRIVSSCLGKKPITSYWTDHLQFYQQSDISTMLMQAGFELKQIHSDYTHGEVYSGVAHPPMWIFEAVAT